MVSGSGTATATGTVQFTVDGAAQGAPVALQVGGLFGTQAQASAVLTNLAAGSHVIGAIYDGSGDPNYSNVAAGNGPDESAFSVTVGAATGAASTTTMLSVATQPMILGDPGSFNVNVAPGARSYGHGHFVGCRGAAEFAGNYQRPRGKFSTGMDAGGKFFGVRGLFGRCDTRDFFERNAEFHGATWCAAGDVDGGRSDGWAFADEFAGECERKPEERDAGFADGNCGVLGCGKRRRAATAGDAATDTWGGGGGGGGHAREAGERNAQPACSLSRRQQLARGGFGERDGVQFFVKREPEPAELQGRHGRDGDDYGDAIGRVYGGGEFELPGGRGAGAGWIYVFVQSSTGECEQREPAIGDDDADANGYCDGGGINRDSARNFLGRSGVMVCCSGGRNICRLDGTIAYSSSWARQRFCVVAGLCGTGGEPGDWVRRRRRWRRDRRRRTCRHDDDSIRAAGWNAVAGEHCGEIEWRNSDWNGFTGHRWRCSDDENDFGGGCELQLHAESGNWHSHAGCALRRGRAG